MAWICGGSSPLVGSSSTSRSGRPSIAWAMGTRWRMPWLSLRTRLSIAVPSPATSMASSRCASSSGRPVAAQYSVRLSRPDRCGCSPVPSTNDPSPEGPRGAGAGGVPEDADPARRRPDQTHEHPQGRRLARAVRAEQAEDLPAAHLEGKVADGDEAVLVRLGHALEPQGYVLA